MFHPVVGSWFTERFGPPTEAQRQGWAEIFAGRDTLIMAPTGSGKTLAAFLAGIDDLARRALEGRLEDRVYIVYVSPLKALSADVERNLQAPLREIERKAVSMGRLLPPIRCALRTGDTSPKDRARMLKHPPHVLVTTPESLYLLATSPRGRDILRQVETVIVDEAHALYGNKRGAHLALTLERLDAWVQSSKAEAPSTAQIDLLSPVQTKRRRLRPQRIGLSATAEPAGEVARFLVGHDDAGKMRDCALIDAGRARTLDLAIEVPKEPLGCVPARSAWNDVYDRLLALIAEHKTVLIFVMSRRLAERVAHDLDNKLTERDGPSAELRVAAHHGALSKRTRLTVEKKLQEGSLRVVVATASLELGIDIGDIDLVCQISSPRSIAVLRQRIGRAGHAVHGLPKGRIFALTRDDLLECGSLVRALRRGRIDKPVVRTQPLDILSQQMVAACSTGPWTESSLYAMCRRAAPYAELSHKEFSQVLDVLADGISTRRGRNGAHLHFDRINRNVRGRRGAKLTALTCGGAIPDKADYQVIEDPTEAVVGTLDEDFAIESMAGDIFLLGSTSWRIRRVENGKVRVEDANGLPPTIPFWNGEGLARTEEVSEEVASLRQEILARADEPETAITWLMEECAYDRASAEQAVQFVCAGEKMLGALPTTDCIVAERFFDDSGGMQLIVHAPFGARINRAWGLALRKKFCRTFDFELQAVATDDGVLLSLGPQHSFPLEAIFGFLNTNTIEETLIQAMLPAPMWETRWRWNSVRSFAVLRFSQGRPTPPPLIRMRAQDVLAAVFPARAGCQDNHGGDLELPDHPLVNETVRDCLNEAMDLEGLRRVLGRIQSGEVRCVAKDTVAPSPFAEAIIHANPYAYLDDAPLEERRTRAVSKRPDTADSDLTVLDPTAIAAVVSEAEPDPQGPDELHDLLCTTILLEPRRAWQAHFESLVAESRAARFGDRWVAAETLHIARALYDGEAVEPALPQIGEIESQPAARRMVLGHLGFVGPISVPALATMMRLSSDVIEIALAELEGEGLVLQIKTTDGIAWCERGLLQRIHRRTIRGRRERVRPVTPADYMQFLLRWQHVAPGSQLHGVDGLRTILGQLEGWEATPSAWERDILPMRVAGYDPRWLDELCFSGEVVWGRLRMASVEPGRQSHGARSKYAAISLWTREHTPWLLQPISTVQVSALAEQVATELERGGALFAADLAQRLGAPTDSVQEALWELVRAGRVSCDGFSAVRGLFDEKVRRGGRWVLLNRSSQRLPGPFADGSPVEHAMLYLRRYGVVCRAVLSRESEWPPWRELCQVYRRLEARGEVQGGRFVSGLTGEQFALPEAAEAIAAMRRVAPVEVALSGTDPLNLVGFVTPGAKVPAVLNERVVLAPAAEVSP